MTKKSILIVDDNPTNLKLFNIVLTLENYDVQIATNALETLQILSMCRPQLILMDLQLPDMDGLELTKQLKVDPNYQDIIIIAVTAYAMKGDKEKALSAGCDSYISKPVDIQHLVAKIASYFKSDQNEKTCHPSY